MIFLTIENDCVVAKFPDHDDRGMRVIRNAGDYNALLRLKPKMPLYASSSLDFPEEYTSNAETIALAKAIRA